MRRAWWIIAAAVVGSACALTEQELVPGEQTLVVQLIIDRSVTGNQTAILEYSVVGDTSVSGNGSSRVPPGRPRFPVSGATVAIEHLAGACPGRVETLTELPPTAPAVTPTGQYRGVLTCLVPGEKLRLRVTTLAGEIATGETVIPGANTRSVATATVAARFSMDTLPFDRERDTLRVSMDPAVGTGMQVEVRRAEDHDHISLIFIHDSMGVTFPGNLVNPFTDQEFGSTGGETTFRAGAYYLMTLALGDSNYYHFASTFSDPITGRGFLNHIKGGLGVFGSIETTQYMLRVVGPVNDPREGGYRLTGRVGNVDLDLSLEAYMDHLAGDFSAFARGTWTNGAANGAVPIQVDVSGDGAFSYVPGVTPNSSAPFYFAFNVVRTTAPTFRRYLLVGNRSADGTPFPLDLTVSGQNGATVLRATITAMKSAGPSP